MSIRTGQAGGLRFLHQRRRRFAPLHKGGRPPPFVDSSGGGISALRLVRSVRSCAMLAKSVFVLKTKVSCPAAASGGFVCYWLSGSERGLLPAAPRQPPRYQMWEIPGTRSTPLEPLSASTVWGTKPIFIKFFPFLVFPDVGPMAVWGPLGCYHPQTVLALRGSNGVDKGALKPPLRPSRCRSAFFLVIYSTW